MLYDGEHYDSYHAVKKTYDCMQPKDKSFWIEMAKAYGDPILELGCGTGRVSVPLAKEGFSVTGIDISESMLKRARKNSSTVEWIQGDVRSFDLEKTFPLIIYPYESIHQMLNFGDLEAMLCQVRSHLTKGGKFIATFLNPSNEFLLDLLLFGGKRVLDGIYPSPDGKGNIVSTMTQEYDSQEHLLTYNFFFNVPGEPEEIVEKLPVRLYFPREMEALLKYNGFAIEHWFGDYDRSPYNAESPYMIVTCEVRD